MAQPRWTMILVLIVPVGLLILIVLSITIINLRNTSHNFNHMFLKEQKVIDLLVPVGEPELDLKKNLNQLIMQNFTEVIWPIKSTIKYGITNGLIMIVNASSENEANSIFIATSQNRATSNLWDINEALDGSMGEMIAQIMEEINNIEEAKDAVINALKICNQDNNLDQKSIQKNISKEKLESTIDWPYKLHWYGPSLHSLVVFSSFRFSQTNFFVVVLLGTLPLEKSLSKNSKLDSCAWIHWRQASTDSHLNNLDFPWNEKHIPIMQMGILSVTVVSETHRTTYDVAIIKCNFEDPAGANAKGGQLYIKLNNEFCPVFQETLEEINEIQFEGEFKYDFAFCSPPILWDFNVMHLQEWFMYHQFLFYAKKTHYFIYHGIDMNNKIMEILDPFIKQGLLTLIDIRSSQSNLLSGQYPSHHLAINDCLHRVRFLTKWAFFWTFEDYLTISFPHTISSILDNCKNVSWVSLGSILWSNMYCCAPNRQTIMLNKAMWIVDEMCFRMEHPICNDKNHSTTCSGVEGQRKWIANPRLVYAASIHYALDSESNGVVLDTIVARFNVYKGLFNPNLSKDNCMVNKLPKDFDDDIPLNGMWWKDLSMRNYTEAAHFYASSNTLFNINLTNPSLP